ncbi:hypothetical protein [Mangrovibacterium sp.]|uniref:hypothetical protein n=1 Tax=Mangrovibacterium sp. TaxID=1961364 RepID=UPI00356677B1
MKKMMLSILLATMMLIVGRSDAFAARFAQSGTVEGVYKTNFKNLTLSANYNFVSGTYESGNGKLQGTLNGNILTGTWTNSGSNKSGKFEFIFSSDFSSFTGKYGYNNSSPSSKWSGTKISSPPSSANTSTPQTSISTKPSVLPSGQFSSNSQIVGRYSTNFNELSLNTDGNSVSGTYESGNGKLQGTLNGNILTGTWTNSGSNKSGKFEFIFSSDFSSFVGKYGYNNSAPNSKWNGKKISGIQVESSKLSGSGAQVFSPDTHGYEGILGVFKTDFDKMILYANGDELFGEFLYNGGRIRGTIKNRIYTGNWSQTNGKGKFEFIFNSDHSAFEGKRSYDDEALNEKWNGVRTREDYDGRIHKLSGGVYSSGTATKSSSPQTQSSSNKNSNGNNQGNSNNIVGTYKTTFGNLSIIKSGNGVVGSYEGGNGKLEGTLEDNKLTGNWKNRGSGKNGKFEFTFTSDFSSFTGKFGYNEGVPFKKWNGTK